MRVCSERSFYRYFIPFYVLFLSFFPVEFAGKMQINDPEAIKPDEWNDSAEIIDPGAKIPAEWNEDEDGEWEPPTIPNPAYTVRLLLTLSVLSSLSSSSCPSRLV